MSKVIPTLRTLIVSGALGLALTAAVPAMAAVDIVLGVAPPEPQVEVVPGPRAGFVWAPGYWEWRSGRHVWVGGHWMHERRGFHWEADRWAHDGDHYHYYRGHWAHD